MIKIDVTNMVNFVKKHNLLFYPLLIHVLTKTLYKSGVKDIVPAYLSVSEKGILSLLSQEFDEDFEFFFQSYVQTCYKHRETTDFLPQGALNGNIVLISYLPEEAIVDKISSDVSLILISPLEETESGINLYLQAKNIEIDNSFVSIFDSFGRCY